MNEDKVIAEIKNRINFIDKTLEEDIDIVKEIVSKPYKEIVVDKNITELHNVIDELHTMLYCKYMLEEKILKNNMDR